MNLTKRNRKSRIALLFFLPFFLAVGGNCTKNKVSVNSNDVKAAHAFKDTFTSILSGGGEAPIPPYNAAGLTLPGAGPSAPMFQKPCANRMGVSHPEQGEGHCTGNLYTEVMFPTTGVSLAHNSLGESLQFGMGAGFNLDVDARFIVITPNAQAVLYKGDGSSANFHWVSSKYVSDDPRIDDSTFTLSRVGWTQRFVNGTVITYRPSSDASEFLLAYITDRQGETTTYTRNAKGQITQITDPDQNSLIFSYSNELLTSFSDLAGGDYVFQYDERDRLTKITFPDTRRGWSFTYEDESGRIASRTDANGKTLKYTYYVSGDLESIKNNLGYVTAFEYTATTFLMKTSSYFIKETFSNGLLIASEYSGNITNYTRDTKNRVSKMTDSTGAVTTFTYDTNDPLASSVVYPLLEGSIAYARNANRQLTSSTFVRGTVKEVSVFDPVSAFGQLTQKTSTNTSGSGSSVTVYTYDDKGNVTTITKNGKKIASYSYDTKGRQVSSTDVANLTQTYAYDGKSNLIGITDPLGRTTTFSYDELGNVTQTITPRTKHTQQFNALGQREGLSTLSSVDGKGGKIEAERSANFYSSGAISGMNSSVKVSGVPVLQRSTTYNDPSVPGRVGTSLLKNINGDAYDLQK